jgi:hypothetical protein
VDNYGTCYFVPSKKWQVLSKKWHLLFCAIKNMAKMAQEQVQGSKIDLPIIKEVAESKNIFFYVDSAIEYVIRLSKGGLNIENHKDS